VKQKYITIYITLLFAISLNYQLVGNCFNYQPKVSDACTHIIDCPAEPHRLPVLAKVKKILENRLSHASVETHVSLVKANMVCVDVKQ